MLLHEMCHIGCPDHGKQFMVKMARLNSMGAPIHEEREFKPGFYPWREAGRTIADLVPQFPEGMTWSAGRHYVAKALLLSVRDLKRQIPWAQRRWERLQREAAKERKILKRLFNGSLTGDYGCLGHATISDNAGTLMGVSELMRLSLDGPGKIKGKIIFNLSGEVCTIATTGTYNVNFGGMGTMNLTWNTVTGDADGDINCATSLPSALTQHTDLVVVFGGAAFEIQGSDDTATGPSFTSDTDLQNPLVGTCRKQ